MSVTVAEPFEDSGTAAADKSEGLELVGVQTQLHGEQVGGDGEASVLLTGPSRRCC